MNRVCLTGNLVRDIDMKSTPQGTCVVSNCIAVSRDRKNNDGTYETDFINFVAWDKKAEYLRQYAIKGDKLELEGRLQVRKFQDKNDNTQSVVEVVVDNIRAIPTATREAKEQKNSNLEALNLPDDDLPF